MSEAVVSATGTVLVFNVIIALFVLYLYASMNGEGKSLLRVCVNILRIVGLSNVLMAPLHYAYAGHLASAAAVGISGISVVLVGTLMIIPDVIEAKKRPIIHKPVEKET